MSERISIVCTCENHFVVLLAAMIKSLELNHKTSEIIDLYIIDDKINKRSKVKISNSVNKNLIQIHWLKMKECIPKGFDLPKDKSTYPINVYMKLFIPYLLPKTVEKAIFLDVDMIVLNDISELWKTDLQGNVIGAVTDQFIKVVSAWGGIQNYEELNLNKDSPYFNTGLMLIDLKKWVDLDVTKKVLDFTNKNHKFGSFGDQYGINAILANKWFSLNSLWNRFAYSTEDRPYIIHFTGRKPIYKTYEYSKKYQEIFYSYLNMTPWKNAKPIGETSRYISKFKNVLTKIRKMF